MKNLFSKMRKNEPSQEDRAETVKPTPRSRGKARFNLQIKLPVAVIVILILAFVGLTILSVSVSRATLTKTLQSSLQTEASLQAESIRSHLTWTRSMAIDLSTVAESMNLDEETSKQVIAQMLSQNEQVVGSTIAYEPYQFKPDVRYWAPYYNRTNDGSLQFTQLGTPENNYPSQDWYKLAKEADGIILSPPYFDTGGAKIWMVTWSVPFHDASGKLKGVATTDIAFTQTQDIVRQIAVGKRGYAFLIDQDGVILGIGDQGGQHNIMEDHLAVSNASEQETSWNNVIKQMIGGQSGFANVVDPQGNAMFVEYQPIGMNTGWSLGLAYPQEELFQPAIQLQSNLILLSTIVVVIASVTLFLFSLSITRPLQQITTWANLVSQGENNPALDQVVSPLNIHTNDEIEDLAETFNQMRQELGRAFGTLEQRVSDRTKALTTVSEISTAASTVLDTDKLLQQVVDLAKERFNLYHTHIYLLNEAGDTLVLASGAGEVGRQMVAEGRSIPLDREQSLVAHAAREKKGVTVNDVTQAPDFLPHPLLPDTHSEMAVPMMVGEQVIGVFDVQSEIVGRFSEADIAVQTTLASQIASAVQNARSYTKVREAQQLTRTIIDSTDDWIFVKDRNHRYVLVNQGYSNSLHIPIGDFIGKDDLDLRFPEELVKGNPAAGIRGFWADDNLVFETGKTQHYPNDPATIDGVVHVFDTLKVPLRDASDKVWAVLGYARDVTERERSNELNKLNARQQEAINLITQKIQSAVTVEEALQVAAREVGHVLGGRETIVALEPPVLVDDMGEKVVNEKSRSTL
jgi:GAF domain-containing protein/HAMP domain-containing protein